MTTQLHNMSMRSRTSVPWRISPLSESVVRFELEGLAADVARLGGLRSRAHTRASAVRLAVEGADASGRLADALEEQWSALGLKGAILVYAPPRFQSEGPVYAGPGTPKIRPTGPKGTQLRATDPALVLNVLARTRANVLLPATPLRLQADALDRAICSDDPRLVAAARAGGAIVTGMRSCGLTTEGST